MLDGFFQGFQRKSKKGMKLAIKKMAEPFAKHLCTKRSYNRDVWILGSHYDMYGDKEQMPSLKSIQSYSSKLLEVKLW